MFIPQFAKTAGHIPDDVGITEFIFSTRPKDANEFAFIDSLTGQKRTWPQVQQRTAQLARGMAKTFGIKVGDDNVFGLFAPNIMEVPTTIWAALSLGGTVTGMNPAYTSSEVQHQLHETGAICLFTCKALLSVAEQACKAVNAKIILLDGDAPGCISFEDLIQAGQNAPQLPQLKLKPGEGKKRLAFLSFSSGTTGKPKGVMISHYNLIANVLQMSAFYEVDKAEGANSLGLLPFYHIYGLVVILHSEIYLGNTITLMPAFDLEKFLDAAEQYKLTKLHLVPPIIVRLTKDPSVAKRGKPLSTIKELFCGAAPLAPQLMGEMRKLCAPDVMFRQGYGMTETCTVTLITHKTEDFDGSVGNVVPDVEIRLVDANGKDITAYDTPGEIWARGPNVTLGYYKNKSATDECYLPGGWLRTGDEAEVRLSKTGKEHFFIVDRLKELIKVKGLQVAPAELEAALLDHAAVADAAVIGIPDERAGELPKAFIVLHAGEKRDEATRASILKHIESTKANFKWIKGGLEFLDAIPKSASGKILRKDLRLAEKQKAKL